MSGVPKDQRSLERRFWSKVNKNGPIQPHCPEVGPCWVWTASCAKSGYGQLNVDGVPVGAHRLSWKLHNGPIPDGIEVLHKCDHKPCIRPEHLFLGTQAENMADMAAKGRAPSKPGALHIQRGDSHYSRAHPESVRRGANHHWTGKGEQFRGSRNGSSKLTDDQVAEIRREYAVGTTQKQLAVRFGTHQTNVSLIVRGATW